MVRKVTPTYDFDQYFGKHPEEYFTAGRIATAERVYKQCIEENQDNAIGSMVGMIESMITELADTSIGQTMDDVIDHIYAQAFSIKCNAGMYGYPLATAFANQLFYYCREIAGKPLSQNMQACMRAHLEALRIIFKNKIRSMTDPTALELLKELEKPTTM